MKKMGIRLVTGIAGAALLLWFFAGVRQLQVDYQKQGLEQLETAIRRAAVACYGAEGIYPPNVAYLQEHYGLQLDESRYVVFYEVFGENLMPQITVLEKGS